MKKISVLLLAAALTAGLASCAKKEANKKASDSRPTIRLVTDATGIDDKSFNAAAWRGIVEFYGESVENAKSRGSLYDVVTCQTQDQYLPTLKQLSDEGYDLICATGFTFSDAITEIADEYPEQKYMIVDVDWVGRPNVKEFVFHEEEGSYLVGLAAAYQAQADGISNPKFGFIGGVPGSTRRNFRLLRQRLGQARTGQDTGQELVQQRHLRHLLGGRRNWKRNNRPGQGNAVRWKQCLGHRR